MNKVEESKQNTTYPLRLPQSLRKAVSDYAKQEGTSMNQFISLAVAEKLSAINTEKFFKQRADRADMGAFWKLLNREGGQPPREGDELPKGLTYSSDQQSKSFLSNKKGQ